MTQGGSIIPTLRYDDAHAAISWLCDMLGFEVKVSHDSEDKVYHAQLTLGHSMIIVSSRQNTSYDRLLIRPSDVDNQNTQSPYIFVTDLEKHYEHCTSKGADIVLPMTTEDHGSGYTVRDPEGHIWNIGDYNPWED